MNFKAIFGPVFFSVLAALILYDLAVKGLVATILPGKNGYDNSFDPSGKFVRALRDPKSGDVFRGIDGKLYRVK